MILDSETSKKTQVPKIPHMLNMSSSGASKYICEGGIPSENEIQSYKLQVRFQNIFEITGYKLQDQDTYS